MRKQMPFFLNDNVFRAFSPIDSSLFQLWRESRNTDIVKNNSNILSLVHEFLLNIDAMFNVDTYNVQGTPTHTHTQLS